MTFGHEKKKGGEREMEAEISELLDRLLTLLGVPQDPDTMWDSEETERKLVEIRSVLEGKEGLEPVCRFIVKLLNGEWDYEQEFYTYLEAAED
ncbi:MAG: hypothetical protein A2Z24_02310 [Candidatus Woykebacteria bacterium RBG_16_44_10]|uniref:Uncharacterized protein n=1 Tax=Candidatus Woykebacteria bacterium RBG_16_44_10 TaxID=1802597 RepID=A0A1G1WGR1_9BACT|nr:MAG: hypothetical protein A2Z24_02310 [Candidatus Woykebacteria bacterium RBG_16_44_10]